MHPTANFCTQRLTLQAPKEADAAELSRLSSDYDVSRMTGTIPYPNPPDTVLAWMQRLQTGAETAFVARADDAIIGVGGFVRDHREIGYWIGKPFWHQGFGGELARTLVAMAFSDPNRDRLEASYFVDNPVSGRIIRACGFQPAGSGQGFSVARNAAVDILKFALTRAAYEARQGTSGAIR
jgi:[ribosomal protein S5]-alanine N-acetyltransferase